MVEVEGADRCLDDVEVGVMTGVDDNADTDHIGVEMYLGYEVMQKLGIVVDNRTHRVVNSPAAGKHAPHTATTPNKIAAFAIKDKDVDETASESDNKLFEEFKARMVERFDLPPDDA